MGLWLLIGLSAQGLVDPSWGEPELFKGGTSEYAGAPPTVACVTSPPALIALVQLMTQMATFRTNSAVSLHLLHEMAPTRTVAPNKIDEFPPGNIPPVIGFLGKLETLSLGSNDLSGEFDQ